MFIRVKFLDAVAVVREWILHAITCDNELCFYGNTLHGELKIASIFYMNIIDFLLQLYKGRFKE